MERLVIGVAVGYMLKVLKAKKNISAHKPAFDAIRHGDYIKFINLIGGPIPHMAVRYEDGTIRSGHIPPTEEDIDFELILKAGNSLKIFYRSCFNTYGDFRDRDLTDDQFERLAIFEINLRVHAKNSNLITREDLLSDVINKLADFKKMSISELEKIHWGRHFLNMVKHDKMKFSSWEDGKLAFEQANNVLRKYKLTADFG